MKATVRGPLGKQKKSGDNHKATCGRETFPRGSLRTRSFKNRLDYVSYRKRLSSRPQERQATQLQQNRYLSKSNTHRLIDFSFQVHKIVRPFSHTRWEVMAENCAPETKWIHGIWYCNGSDQCVARQQLCKHEYRQEYRETVFYAVRAGRAHGDVGSLLPGNEAVNMHPQQWAAVFSVWSVQKELS
jgi:hypothetical protein